MSRKKLTLSVEKHLTERAKAIAEKRKTSVSRLVETFFSALEETEGGDSEQPDEAQVSQEAPATEDDERSAWAKRWHGAFAQEGETYPDAPSWEEEVVTEEISKKHAPQ